MICSRSEGILVRVLQRNNQLDIKGFIMWNWLTRLQKLSSPTAYKLQTLQSQWCNSVSPKAWEAGQLMILIPFQDKRGEEVSIRGKAANSFFLLLLFFSGPQHCGMPANTQKCYHRHTQILFLIWASFGPLKLTHKSNHHKRQVSSNSASSKAVYFTLCVITFF